MGKIETIGASEHIKIKSGNKSKNLLDITDQRKAVTLTWAYEVLKAAENLGESYISLSSGIWYEHKGPIGKDFSKPCP